jgi:hypothetical protein
LGVRPDAKDSGARGGGELDRGLADFAICAKDQHHVALTHGPGFAQTLIGRDEGYTDRARFGEADGGGLFQQVR